MNEPCSICPRKTKCIQPSGPRPAKYMAVGEAPGRIEDLTGIPFSGPTGREWNETYLDCAGIDRSEVFITNVRQCRPANNRKPTDKEIAVCGRSHLIGELQEVEPEILFLMGATATSLFPDMSLDTEHGTPQWVESISSMPSGSPILRTDHYDWSGWVIPLDHPAKGLHDTGAMIPLLKDWERIGRWLESGVWQWPEPSNQPLDYALMDTVVEVEEFFHRYIRKRVDRFKRRRYMVGADTESHAGEPFSWQVSFEPYSGRMVLMKNREICDRMAIWLCAGMACGDIDYAFHNAPADLPIFERQLKTKDIRYRDTMQECYQLGNLPQGLKELGYQLFGVRMQSWEDLVTPYSKLALIEWLKATIDIESGNPIRIEKQLKTKLKVIEKPNETEKWLSHVLNYMGSNPDYDPWARLDGKAHPVTGPYPLKGIANVPLDEAVQYAVRDADITLRLALELEKLRKEAEDEWPSDPEDWDRAPTMAASETSHS